VKLMTHLHLRVEIENKWIYNLCSPTCVGGVQRANFRLTLSWKYRVLREHEFCIEYSYCLHFEVRLPVVLNQNYKMAKVQSKHNYIFISYEWEL